MTLAVEWDEKHQINQFLVHVQNLGQKLSDRTPSSRLHMTLAVEWDEKHQINQFLVHVQNLGQKLSGRTPK